MFVNNCWSAVNGKYKVYYHYGVQICWVDDHPICYIIWFEQIWCYIRLTNLN